ncbi:MAG: hypothetical protein LJE65_16940, partial [Desulfobacteraceae bacterium]|nr:hypothetical protein [Desulfobacteraceae bacterium]
MVLSSRSNSLLLILTFVCLAVTDAKAETLWGPESLQIRRWPVHFSRHRFPANGTENAHLVVVKETPEKRIYGGFVWFNGRLFQLRRFFRSGDAVFEAAVRLRHRNRLLVFFRGQRGAGVSVGVQTRKPPQVVLSLDPDRLIRGETAVLSWEVLGADRVEIQPGIGSVPASGSRTVQPEQTTEYTLTAQGPGGTSTASATATVVAPQPQAAIAASPETIVFGQSSTLSWSTVGADACRMDPDIGTVGLSGTLTVSPEQSTVYRLTATGEGGSTTAEAAVEVMQPPTVWLQADPPTVREGEPALLTWGSDNADFCTISPGVGWVDCSGSQAVTPLATTVYTISAASPAGFALASAEVTVIPAADPPTVTLTVDPVEIVQGEPAVLSWKTQDADRCELFPGFGEVATTGVVSVYPEQTTTYTLTADGPGGTTAEIATVTVLPPEPVVEISAEPQAVLPGESATLTWTALHAETCGIEPDIGPVPAAGSVSVSPKETTAYTLTAASPGGQVSATVTVEVADPDRPGVHITSPRHRQTVDADTVAVTGTCSVTDAVVYVNGQEAVLTDGVFSAAGIPLQPGANRITATAAGQGEPLSDTVYVVRSYTYQPQPEGSFGRSYEDLVPEDAMLASYAMRRFSLATGRVLSPDWTLLPNVAVHILDRPQYGSVVTDAAGRFTLPLEGGGRFTFVFEKAGYLDAQRSVEVPWNQAVPVSDLQMVPEDILATPVVLDGSEATVAVHRSSVFSDSAGDRSCTVVTTGNNRVYVVDDQGMTVSELSEFTLRATQVPNPQAMPAVLPPTSAYTYCVDLSVDQSERVRFAEPVVTWVENFLGFPVGTAVPAGYYDEDRGIWVPADNGVVVRLMDTDADGAADALDADGDGVADDLDGDGLQSDETVGLQDPAAYPPGATFWRVPVTHFSLWDFNFSVVAAPGARPSDAGGQPFADAEPPRNKPCPVVFGSSVEQRTRVLHDDIPVPGTGMRLHYASDRTEGFYHRIVVPASGETIPSSLKRIRVEVQVAGRTLAQELPALPDQTAEFIWDGLDFRGQPVRGSSVARTRVGFVYDGYYATPAQVERSFGLPGGASTGVPALQEVVLWKEKDVHLTRGTGTVAEGWTLSQHHSMHLADLTTLHKGDGTRRQSASAVIETVARMYHLEELDVDAEGNIYIARAGMDIVDKLDTQGNLVRVAGTGNPGFSGDGGPATRAELNYAHSVAVDATGNVFIADYYNNRIRKVDPDGIITTVAGNGSYGFSGDGGPAVDASLAGPIGVDVDPAGNLYIADNGNNRIRKVDPDGVITTVAGSGNRDCGGDGGPALEASLASPRKISVDAEGNIFVICYHKVRKVNPEGIIDTVAGTRAAGYGGDGGPALEAQLTSPANIAVDDSGTLYIADGGNNRVRRVNPSGIITTVAGDGSDESTGDGGAATKAGVKRPWDVIPAPDGSLLVISDGRIRQVAPTQAVSAHGNPDAFFFAEEDGTGHVMDANGRHAATVERESFREIRTFAYDASGRLSAVVDPFGNRLSVERDADGRVQALTSPDGLRTELLVDSRGLLTEIRYPDGSAHRFTYTGGGLMTEKTEPNGNGFHHRYDEQGRLIESFDDEGGSLLFDKTVLPGGRTVTVGISAEGAETRFSDWFEPAGSFSSTITGPSGDWSEFAESVDGLHSESRFSCGMALETDLALDPLFGSTDLYRQTETTPQGLVRSTRIEKTREDDDLDGLPERYLESVTVNGRTAIRENDLSQALRTFTSPEGRTTELSYDPETLRPQAVRTPNQHDRVFGYDLLGRLASLSSDTRTVRYAYDENGFLASVTEADGAVTTFDRDILGRITEMTRPDGAALYFAYDANGNTTVLTNAASVDHGFAYNGVNRPSRYDTPLSGSYRFAYDRDRNPTVVEFPSGKRIERRYAYGRLAETVTPEGSISYAYACGSKPESVTRGSERIDYAYDGRLLTGETLSGTLDRSLAYVYNDAFEIVQFTYAGTATDYTYDADGLLSGSGSFTIQRNAGNGLPETLSDGTFSISRAFNGHGELAMETVNAAGADVFSWSVSRDDSARIVGKTETLGGVSRSFAYSYDAAGRLVSVTRDGIPIEGYDYDIAGTRVRDENTLRGLSGRQFSYSDEDQVLSAGSSQYRYDTDGFLTEKIDPEGTTTYRYSSLGELLEVDLPDSRSVEYLHDPLGRRIGKKVDGNIVEKYLWQGRTRLLAVYDGSDNLRMRFEYADAGTPHAMTREGLRYFLAYDPAGSLRLVADAAGNVVKTLTYDAFGNVLEDTNPALVIPIGFAGGLQDPDTGLVHFGFRDYDPDTGRWTAKDPIFFAGGDTDLYGYCLNDPVNWVDPDGLSGLPGAIIGAVSGGFGGALAGIKSGNLLVGI